MNIDNLLSPERRITDKPPGIGAMLLINSAHLGWSKKIQLVFREQHKCYGNNVIIIWRLVENESRAWPSFEKLST